MLNIPSEESTQMTQTDRERKRLEEKDRLMAITAKPKTNYRDSFTIERFEPDALNGAGEWWECHDTATYGEAEAIKIASFRAKAYDYNGKEKILAHYRVTRERVAIEVIWDSDKDLIK
jgi:hypothetical protein